jgi:hypothetical protein
MQGTPLQQSPDTVQTWPYWAQPGGGTGASTMLPSAGGG